MELIHAMLSDVNLDSQVQDPILYEDHLNVLLSYYSKYHR